jgi:tRNA/rRNA methyltransferase
VAERLHPLHSPGEGGHVVAIPRRLVRVVLVRPEVPANVGAVARTIRNTGLEGLSLVAPGDWRTVECWRTAWGAHDVLEQAQVFDDLAPAVAGAHTVIAFSGKRDRGQPTLDVREAAEEVAAMAPGEGAALVFGGETSGLTLDELAVCGRRALIPSHPDQPSLNLSHAVMVAAYEVFRPSDRPAARRGRATHGGREAMLDLLREGLLAIGALPPANTDRFFAEWRSLFQRADLTAKEVRLLEHMARKMIQRGGGPC